MRSNVHPLTMSIRSIAIEAVVSTATDSLALRGSSLRLTASAKEQ
jgi:hypothetical protein